MSKQFLLSHSLPSAHATDIFSLAVTPSYLVSASGASSLKIHDTSSGPAIHNDSGAEEDPYPLVQTIEKAHPLGCHHVSASAGGEVVGSCGFEGDVRVWELREGVWVERGVIRGEKAGEHWALALSPDGRYLAATTHDGRVNVYDTTTINSETKTAQRVTQFETKGSFGMCVDISPNGELTASGHQNGSVYIFNNSTGRLAHSLSGLVKPVRSVAFSPANRYLAAAGDARVIALYDTQSGEQVANLTGHASWVMGLSWNWSGEMLLSGSYDGKAKIWSIERRECVATQTESEKCLWAVKWLPKAASARDADLRHRYPLRILDALSARKDDDYSDSGYWEEWYMQEGAPNNVGSIGYHITNAPSPVTEDSNIGAMDDNMDLDIDMDLGEDEEVKRMREEAEAINARAQAQAQEAADTEAMNGVEEAPEEGEVDQNGIVPYKVHLRGLNNLATTNVVAALNELCNTELFKKLQWVDDTSANAIFDTEEAAADALAALSAEEMLEPLNLRPMKPTSAAPDSQLHVRMAMMSDVKVRGAKDRSRFYLDHPEADPDTRIRNRRYDSRRNPRDRRPARPPRYDSEDRLQARPRHNEVVFTEDMYGDAPSPDALLRRDSYSSVSTDGRKKVVYDGDDLFAGKNAGRLRGRDRSASPTRDGDGRYGFGDDQPYRRTAARQRTPPPPRRPRRDRLEGPSGLPPAKQDLFADRAAPSALKNGFTNGGNRNANIASKLKKDLFADRASGASGGAKELFPEKTRHHRQDARDIDADEVATAIGPGRAGRPAHLNSHSSYSNNSNGNSKGGDLFSRISGGPTSTGRLNGHGSVPTGPAATTAQDRGFSFKGAGDRSAEAPGFAFKGASGSQENRGSALARELFPMKAGNGATANGGRDLFEGRAGGGRGRGGRKRAEDFY